jgi:CHAD domain-containing protein
MDTRQGFFLPPRFSLHRLLTLLRGLGCEPSTGGTLAGSDVYYDTQNGELWRKGLRLVKRQKSGLWELLRGWESLGTFGPARDEEMTGSGAPPPLTEHTRRLRLVPYLAVTTRDLVWTLPFGGRTAGTMHLLSLRFRAVGDGGRDKRVRIAFFDPLGEAGKEGTHLLTMLRDVGGLAAIEFEPFSTGLGVLGLAPPGGCFLEAFWVTRTDSPRDIACKVLGRQGYQMRINTEGAIEDLDPEFVHDIRVATRRSRFALRLFRPALDPETTEALREEAKWLGRLLGPVRDLDVFQENTKKFLDRMEAGEMFSKAILGFIDSRKNEARRGLPQALRSERYHRLVGRLEKASETFAGVAAPEEPMDARAFGSAVIRKAAKKVRALCPRESGPLPPEALHRLRIACKGLRYTCEFFRELFGTEIEQMIGTLVQIQNCLGAYQDAVTARRLLAAFPKRLDSRIGRSPALLMGYGAFLQIQREEQQSASARCESLLVKFRKRLKTLRRSLRS